MKLLTQNSKIKKTNKKLGTRLFNFGIPAYKSSSGKITCPFADKCVKFCYAKKGAYIWSNVKPAFERRYEATLKEDFTDVMIEEIKAKKATHIRVHDSGDYYSPKYLKKWLAIAEALPEVKFYSYTNSISFFKGLELPSNYDVIFSDSGKQVGLIDYTKDRFTKIFKSEEELTNHGFINASEIDLFATKFFNPTNKKVGLIYH